MNTHFVNHAGNSSNTTSIYDANIHLASWYVIIGVTVTLSNGVVLFVILKSEELRETQTLLAVAFMAFFDLCNGLNNILVGIPSSLLGRFAYGDLLIRPGALVTAFILVQNEFNTALVVMDRFIAVQWPLHYFIIATKKKYAIAFLMSLSLNVARLSCVSFPILHVYYNEDIAKPLVDIRTFVGILATAIVIVTPIIIMIVCSVRIITAVVSNRRRVTMPGAPQDNTGKSTFMVMLSAGVFGLSNVPKVIYVILVFVLGKDTVPKGFVSFCALSVTSSSLWNVFIYIVTYEPFRNSLIKTFFKSYYRKKQIRLVVTFDS